MESPADMVCLVMDPGVLLSATDRQSPVASRQPISRGKTCLICKDVAEARLLDTPSRIGAAASPALSAALVVALGQ